MYTELPHFASLWPKQIANIVSAALERGEVDARDLRSISIVPTTDLLTLGVWLSTEWSDYPYKSDDAVAGLVSLASWLDEVDAIARGEKQDVTLPADAHVPRRWTRFTEPAREAAWRAAWGRLYAALGAVARVVGTQLLAGKFEKQPCGIFAGLDSDVHATLFAFCHANGAPLLPLRERRKEHGFGAAYPQGALADDGLVLFYPEGAGDSLGKHGAASIRRVRFDDMVRATLPDDNGVSVRMKGDVFDITFAPGHTREKNGLPDREAVAAMLRAHIETHRPALFVSDRTELPKDSAALDALLATFGEDHEKWNAVETLIEKYGVDAVAPLCAAAAIDGAIWKRLRSIFARAYLALGRAAEALTHLDQLSGEDRVHALDAEAYFLLGRFADVVAIDAEATRARPWRALAMAQQGKLDEALAVVEAEQAHRDEDSLAAKAIVLADAGRLDEANTTLLDAFAKGSLTVSLERRLAVCTGLAPLLAQRTSRQRERKIAIAELAKVVPTTLAEPPRMTKPVTSAVFLATETELTDTDGKRRELRAAFFDGDRRYVGDRKGHVLDLAADTVLARPFTSAVEGFVPTDAGLVVTDRTSIALLAADGAVLARERPLFHGDGPIAAHGTLLAKANRETIELWRVASHAFTYLGCASAQDNYWQSLAFVAPTVLVGALEDELIAFDVSGPPRVISRVQLPTSDLQFKQLAPPIADHLVVDVDYDRWFVSFADPRAPKALAMVRVESRPFVAPDGEGRVWLVYNGQDAVLIDPRAQKIVDRVLFLDAEGSSSGDFRALEKTASGWFAVTEKGIASFAQTPWRTEPAMVREKLAKQAGEVQTWMRQMLDELLERSPQPIGVIRAGWFDHAASLEAGGAVSISAVGGPLEPYGGVGVQLEFAEANGDENKSDERNDRVLRSIESAAEAARHVERSRALREILLGLRDVIEKSKQAAELVHVAMYDSHSDGYEIVYVAVKPNGVEPKRAVITAPAEKSTRDRLSSSTWHREVDTFTARAKRDATFRAEVLALLVNEQLDAAGRIAQSLAENRPSEEVLRDVRAAWLAVAEKNPAFAMPGLLEYLDDAAVKAKLASLADHDDPNVSLPALRISGRIDEPASIELVKRVLVADMDGSRGDFPARTLAAMADTSLAQLRETLAEVHRTRIAQRDSHGAAEVLLPLARAGITELPEGILDAAQEEQQMEEYADDFGVLSGDDEPGASVTALRHLLLRKIEARLAQSYDGGPLWPSEIPVEKYGVSWGRLMDMLAAHFPAVLDGLHERLPRQLAHASDRALALQLLLHDLMRADPRAVGLGAALETTSEQTGVDVKELDNIKRLARLSRVNAGWALMKAKRFADARVICNAALAETGHDDGQVLFFDARLAWFEKDDPNEAIARIPQALEKASDTKGRGRLYNLYGAALDALAKHDECIAWFEKALTADPTDAAMYLSNIAEAHWKRGAKEDAVRFAEKSKASGGSTAIVKEILASVDG